MKNFEIKRTSIEHVRLGSSPKRIAWNDAVGVALGRHGISMDRAQHIIHDNIALANALYYNAAEPGAAAQLLLADLGQEVDMLPLSLELERTQRCWRIPVWRTNDARATGPGRRGSY